jgi:hypothetical protein
MTALAITPTLYLGTINDMGALKDVLSTTDANEAFHAIREGMTVVLPPNSWNMAIEILRKLDCPEVDIRRLIKQARLGK